MWLVQIFDSSGLPEMARFSVAIMDGGEYRRSLSNPVPENDLIIWAKSICPRTGLGCRGMVIGVANLRSMLVSAKP